MRDSFFRKDVNRKVAIVLCILAFIIAIALNFMVKVTNIRNSFVSKIGVYTPGGISNEYHNELSIDTFEYWIYELNKSEQIEIEEDIKTGQWIPATYGVLQKFGFEQEFGGDIKCYACCYDIRNECFVAFRGSNSYPSPCVIYFYDAVTHYYYCVYWSM